MAFVHTFSYQAPARAAGTGSWAQLKIEESADSLSWADVETQAYAADADETAPSQRTIQTELASVEEGYFRITPIDSDGDEGFTSEVVYSPSGSTSATFATPDCIAARLGRELTDAEIPMAEEFLVAASAIVAAELGKDDEWIASLDPVPEILRSITCALATRVFSNPENVQSYQESLGAYTYSPRFREGASMLTDVERLLIRRAVYGSNAGSSRPASLVADFDPEVVS